MTNLIKDVEITLQRTTVPICKECGAKDNVTAYNEGDTGAKGIYCNNCGSEDFEWFDEEIEVEKEILREMTPEEQEHYNQWWMEEHEM